MLKKIFSNTIIYGLGQNVPKIIAIILLPIITPFLTKTDYGVYGILVAYIGSATIFKQLGFSVILSNSFYKNPLHYKFVWSRVFGFLLLWNIILSILFAGIIILVLPNEVKQDLKTVILLYIIPTIFFDTIVFIGSKYLQYAQRPIPFGIITIIKSIIGYAVLYITVVQYRLGYLGWLYSAFASTFTAALLYSYVIMWRDKLLPSFKFNYKWLKRKLRIALPVIPHFYSVFLLSNSDRIMMDLFGISTEEIGRYSLAYQIGGYFSLIGTALAVAYGPILTKMFKEKRKAEIIYISKLLTVGFIFMAFLLAIWMKDIFRLLVRNESLQDAYPIAMIVVFSFTYFPFYYYVGMFLQFEEKTGQLFKISFLAGVLNVVLNLFAIPYFGIMGAAITTFIGYMFMGYFGLFLKDFRKYDDNSLKYLLFALASSVLLVFSFIIKTQMLKISISIGFLLITYLLIKNINKIHERNRTNST